MYEVNGHEILKVEEVVSKNQKAVIKYHYGMLNKVKLSVNKVTIQANGSDTATITLQWQKFDIEQERYVDDQINTTPFKVDIAGVVDDVNQNDGTATIQFSSAAAGEFEIKTVNPNVDNTSVKVVVQDATG